MYSIIFVLDKLTLEEEQTNQLMRAGCSWVSECSGMREWNGKVPYIAICPSITVLQAVQAILAQIDHPQIIGIWNQDGTQQGYKKVVIHNEEGEITGYEVVRSTYIDDEGNEVETPLVSPFNPSLYLEYMQDIVAYDENGYELSRERPVELAQVQNWAGWGDRIF